MKDCKTLMLLFYLFIERIGPIEVDLAVKANSVAGTIVCGNATSIDSLSCEVRRKSGRLDQSQIPCMLFMCIL